MLRAPESVGFTGHDSSF